MGCAICLEGFAHTSPATATNAPSSSQTERDERAAALACGHLYHATCLAQWYAASSRSKKTNTHVCCLCKSETPVDRVVNLFPTESGDLDTYLAHRHLDVDPRLLVAQQQQQRQAGEDAVEPPSAALPPLENREEAEKLLASLLDLNQHLQHWVMAVHGVRVDTVARSGLKIKRLVADLTPADVLAGSARQDLESSLTSLETAARTLDSQRKSYFEAEDRLSQHKKRLKAKAHTVTQQAAQVKQRHLELDAKLADLRQQREALEAVLSSAESASREQAAREASLAARQEAIETQSRDLERQGRQIKLEASQKVRAMEQNLLDRTLEAEERVSRAEAAEREARRERDDVAQKNNLLADQLRFLQNEVKKTRMKLEKRSGDEAREVASLRRRLAEVQKKLARERAERVDDDHHLGVRGAGVPGQGRGQGTLTPSSSSPITAEGRSTMTMPPSSPTPSVHPPSALGGGISRRTTTTTAAAATARLPSSTLLVESEDLDDELFDDNLYPMPGLNALRPPLPVLGGAYTSNFTPTAVAVGAGQKRVKTTSAPIRHRKHQVNNADVAQRSTLAGPSAGVVAPPPCQSTLKFHRSNSDHAVHPRRPLRTATAAAEGEGDGIHPPLRSGEVKTSKEAVIDLCSSPLPPSASATTGEDKENATFPTTTAVAAAAGRGENTGFEKRADTGTGMGTLHSWIQERNGVVLGPKRRRR